MFFLLYRHADDGHADDCVFDDFPKIFQNCSEGQTNVPEHFLKISQDVQRLSRKTRRCFDDTPTNLSTI